MKTLILMGAVLLFNFNAYAAAAYAADTYVVDATSAAAYAVDATSANAYAVDAAAATSTEADIIKYIRMSESAEVKIEITSTNEQISAATDEAYSQAMTLISKRCDPAWGESNFFDVVTMADKKEVLGQDFYLITAEVTGLCKKFPERKPER